MPIALDVGRSTFGLFGRCEAVLAIALVVSALDFSDGRFDSAQIVLSTLCSAIVTLQLFWLRPFLDHRVSQILDGEDPPKSKAHKIYIALEVAKLVGLAGIVAYS